MSADADPRKLDAIVGAAIRALVESGTSDEQIGSFAASHRVKVAEILGHRPSAAAQPPELLDLVGVAVRQALVDAGVARIKPAVAKRFYVLVAGKRTSLTISPELIDRLSQQNGLPKAKSIVQDIASKAPADVVNRSGWVEERLSAYLAAPSATPDLPATRH